MTDQEKYPCVQCGHVCGEVTPSDVTKIREIHGWLTEIMPAARVAIKLMDARANLTRRWRGNAKG